MIPRHQAMLQSLLDAERSKAWSDETIGTVARLLAETADRFLVHGELWACETAERMGVTAGEVWLETIFRGRFGGCFPRGVGSSQMREPTNRFDS